eukprot:5251988-Pleurochrysis_carterae.AAC.1
MRARRRQTLHTPSSRASPTPTHATRIPDKSSRPMRPRLSRSSVSLATDGRHAINPRPPSRRSPRAPRTGCAT